MTTKEEVLDLLWERPVEIGHWVGFKDLTELHNEWLRSFLYEDDDQTLQGHRGSYKTTTLALFFALHIIIKPNETVLFFRKTDTDVKEVIKTTSKILKSGCVKQMVRILYGKDLVLIIDSNSEIHTNLATSIKGASQLVGLGIGTSITGKHADIVVTDDIVNIKDRISKADRDHTKLAYQELQNIKNRGGRFINTGTPWHKEDAFALMPNIKRYDCYTTGLISEEELQSIRDGMTASLFAANYELRHIAEEDVIFKNAVKGGEPEMVQQAKFCHIDAAYGGEDFTAFTIARKHDGKIYVYGKLWSKHVDDCMNEILMLKKSFMVGKTYCENNADKGYLRKELRRRGDDRVVGYQETMNKFIKIVSYLKGDWKNIVFVQGTDEEYIQQILDYNENAEHDDAPDSLACAVRLLYGKREDKDRYKPQSL